MIDENLIMTHHHVVGESNTVTVKFGSGFEVKGDVVAYKSGRDVALVKIQAALPKHFNRVREVPVVGSEIYAVRSPLSDQLSGTVSKGIVSGLRTKAGKSFIQSDVNVRPGSSGGPLVTQDGNVVGINVSGIRVNGAGQGVNFFIPIADALDSMGIK